MFTAATGKLAAAEELILQAMTIYERSFGPGTDHPLMTRALSNLAELAWRRGSEREAEEYCRRALALLKPVESDISATASTLRILACLYSDQGKPAQAEPLFLRALALIEERPQDHPLLAEILSHLARLHAEQGRYREAADHFARALAISRRLQQLEPDLLNKNLLASILIRQGAMYRQMGDGTRALACWTEADTMSELFTSDLEDVALLDTRATVLLLLGRAREAQPLVDKILATDCAPESLALAAAL
jgi:tetratricopeptide (TPR) repeat protein